MRTVIVDRKDLTLEVKRSGLLVGEQQIPFRLVDLLVLGRHISMESGTLLRLGREEIPVIIVGRREGDFSLVLPMRGKNGELKLAQYRAHERNRLGMARYFLGEKLRTHIEHLRRMGVVVEERSWRERLEAAVSVPELMGVEGSFASLYFRHYFAQLPPALHKGRRSKRPPADPVNALLSYLYTYFYHLVTARLYLFGFDPSIGYLHEPFRSHHALASDLLECFRVAINERVAGWFLEEELAAEDFGNRGGIYLRTESRKALWPRIKEMGETLQPRIDDEIALLRSAIS
jgi:CRISPR-associated protein Cas1